MATANELYFSSFLRHQVDMRRYAAGLVNRVSILFERADRELSIKLRERLAAVRKPVDLTSERWKALSESIRGARDGTQQAYRDMLRGDLTRLSSDEAEGEYRLLESVIPIDLNLVSPDPRKVRAVVTQRPLQGKLLKDWFNEVSRNDKARTMQALQMGMVQGEPIDDIVRRLVGTRANQYADGILSSTRREATAVARTAVNHVSNAARESVWDENEDIISALIWTATLDGRTSAVCRARDGLGVPTGGRRTLPEGVERLEPGGARPPAHPNCRSLMVAFIDGVGVVGNRPTVKDTRTRREREIDFRAMAKEQGRPIQEIRKEWAEQNIGRMPAKTTYEQWLRTQDAAFQDEVLGKAKGRLFREGVVKLTQFVDREGNELNLDELRKRHPGLIEDKKRAVDYGPGVKGELLTAAFTTAPLPVQRLVEDATREYELDEPDPNIAAAYHIRSERTIYVDASRPTDRKTTNSTRHEVGHVVDYYAGEVKGTYGVRGEFVPLSHGKNYQKAFEKDAALNETALSKPKEAFQRKVDQTLDRVKWERVSETPSEEVITTFNKEWAKVGVSFDQVKQWVDVTEVGELADRPSRYWYRHAKVLTAYREGRIDELVEAARGERIWSMDWSKGNLGHISDSGAAISRGEVLRYDRGYATHTMAYWQERKTNFMVELFAETFEAEALKNDLPFVSKIYERFFPNQTKIVRETIEELGGG